MAQIIPTLGACRFDSPGEKRLAERLEKKLPDDWLCWFNVPVGPKGLQPDFVLLHPEVGLLILEVKDWKLSSLKEVTINEVTKLEDGREVTVINPMAQARKNAFETKEALEKDPALTQKPGSIRAGKLLMPYTWGVVLPEMTRKEFTSLQAGSALQSLRVICKDEMFETVDAGLFEQRFKAMFVQHFPVALSDEHVDRVRYHLFPEIRLNPARAQFGLFGEQEAPMPSLIKVMDLQQEQLARSMGSGHRVIHGVAGSGKTMVLVYRSLYLARTSSKPVLVLCYNKTLAARLNQVLKAHQQDVQVVAMSFHAWCRKLLTDAQLPIPQLKGQKFFQALEDDVLKHMADGKLDADRYAAILIDEGHDFKPEWFRLVVHQLDQEQENLLVLYDDAQAIYRGKATLASKMTFSFASVGIKASGRTTILRINYRNTLEVLSVAHAFSKDLLSARDAEDDHIPVLAPQSAGRRGDLPQLLSHPGLVQEAQCLVARLEHEQANGRAWQDMAVIYREGFQATWIEDTLKAAGIPYTSAKTVSKRSALYGENTVKIVSMHSSKGLEFGFVVIPRLHEMPVQGEDEADEMRLLYVAMTRAVDRLVMTHQTHSGFTERLQEAVAQVQASL
ncbi:MULTISPECIES: 3'-5' exonuclease [unclassified Pseudomonas]|uniref:3'-5' exonuclease n=1 Tax=unclassified Pseudomonas TaxID=196821 RepID=UPI0018D7474F|nr:MULTISPECIES: 3'-5' exonuclease [unclassified Pseudomonas]MBH3364179.1 NERD domain-containing protein [Pseudomonas sp. URMO17WK12:I11]